LRDFWRHLLTHSRVSIGDDVLLDAASELVLDQADPLAALGEALLEVATATTESEMLDSIAAAFASQRTRCHIEKERVIRASPFDDEVKGRQIVTPVLIIDDEHAIADAGHASAALTAWIAAEQREYYRIHLPRQRATAVADPGLGVYWLKTTDNMQRLPEPSGEGPAWRTAASASAAGSATRPRPHSATPATAAAVCSWFWGELLRSTNLITKVCFSNHPGRPGVHAARRVTPGATHF